MVAARSLGFLPGRRSSAACCALKSRRPLNRTPTVRRIIRRVQVSLPCPPAGFPPPKTARSQQPHHHPLHDTRFARLTESFNLLHEKGTSTSHLICGGCRTVLRYPTGAESVRCAVCTTVNRTAEVQNTVANCRYVWKESREDLLLATRLPSQYRKLTSWCDPSSPSFAPLGVTVVALT